MKKIVATFPLKILAIETSSEAFSIALCTENKTFEHFAIAPMQHAELILPNIEKILFEAELELKQLDCIAVSCGPGSFTSVRLGVSIAQGLAFTANLPVIPVSTLHAFAQGAHEELGATHILVATDARMHEVYWAAYASTSEHQDQNIVQAVVPDSLAKPDAITLPEDFFSESVKWVGIGNGWQVYKEQMLQSITEKLEFYSRKNSLFFNELQKKTKNPAESFLDQHLTVKSNFYPHAKYVAKIALKACTEGKAIAADEVMPVYLRDAVTHQM